MNITNEIIPERKTLVKKLINEKATDVYTCY